MNRLRSYFSFSLRTLLIGTALLAILLGWLGSEYRRYERERSAAERLTSKGGVILMCDRGDTLWFYQPSIDVWQIRRGRLSPRVTWVQATKAEVNSAWIPLLQDFSNLKTILLTDCKLDGDADPFASLKGLEEVYVADSDLRVAHLHSIAKLPQLQRFYFLGDLPSPHAIYDLLAIKSLRKLQLDPTPIPDHALQQMASLPELEYLNLNQCIFNADAAASIAELNRLEGLSLSGTAVDDRAFESADFDQLVSLELSGCPITDRGLKEIVRSFRLSWLDLSHTQITDAGAKELLKLPWLQHLDVRATKLTAESLGTLKQLRAKGVNVQTDLNLSAP